MSSEEFAAERGALTSPAAVRALLENQAAFLGFLEKRVGDRATAEDILQDALERGLDHVQELRSDESAVAWFYRTLRNAVIDRQRRGGTQLKALQAFEAELATAPESSTETHAAVCRCVGKLANSLRPEYAEALRRIEVDGVAVKDYALEAGISQGAAGVRVFRAREALRRQVRHSCGPCARAGCLDCTCNFAADASE
ncbi:MAG: sigma-70 family RNA polymerase sigma factor [Polyangiaceae bacterium]